MENIVFDKASHLYPDHVGIIMDGNGRWATMRSLERKAGHYEGIKAAKRVTSEAASLGIPYLTFYVFSTENWRRPPQEVSYLMDLIASRLFSEIDFLRRIGARVLVRGDYQKATNGAREALEATVKATGNFKNITVVLAVNHGGHDEIVRSVNAWLKNRKGQEPIDAQAIRENIDLAFIPPVDLIIRAGGQKRLSNFMLWDSAYAELAFYDTLWPDWDGKLFKQALTDYSHRNRQFGGVT
ncbi:MAG: polyprenyl diphosphate synthase [Sphaerochaetaceae bacterium]